MNYYEHHIGDYDKNTSHLTACEDGIYCRMIRRYYDKERPLDADVNEIKRVVRARTREEKSAVDTVLREFFRREDDGWHHDKCDEAIAIFQAGEPEREAKKKNEDTRLARHRQERAELFKVINGAGFHMIWNAPIAEVRAAAERIRNGEPPKPATPVSRAPATPPVTGPATPATATHTPVTRHQAPDTKHQTPDTSTVDLSLAPKVPEAPKPEPPPPAPAPATRGSRLAEDWQLPKAWGDWALAEYSQWSPEKVRLEGQKFRNHWTVKTGKDATKLSWERTWQNWCHSPIAHQDDPKPGLQRPMSTADRDAEARRLLGFDQPQGSYIDA